MQTIIILFVLTLGLTLTLKLFVTPKYGTDVANRFLERLKYIPSQTEVLSAITLRRWLADKANDSAIRGYIYPVLFPIDILFLLALGLLLGFASAALAGGLGFLSNVPHWIWWVLPAAYMASDLVEDTIIAAIFKSRIALTENSFRLLSALTAIKLSTVTSAIAQVVFLGALNGLLILFPASKPF
ncbi:hypothetical protein CQ14_09570 [Bradyrhizobium lablabi]|uniref:Uncharacterized protein n=1 Tax=Bradyrhizobium lablabi TaxID=722472 RepID=A0A0R3MYU3_9BRAD|nr:hypothetical protein [Bradyrhizobium lablabi]KRR25256.1 hypothetical protein CQ14_09570 [Bradyrhizobium lablabi]